MIILRESIIGKVASLCFVFIIIVSLSGCSSSPETFEEYYLNYHEEIGNDIVKVDILGETEIDEFVFVLAANYNSDGNWGPGLSIHKVLDDGWEQVNGSSCTSTKIQLGYDGKYSSYCGMSESDPAITQVMIGEQEVEIIEYEGTQLWYYAEKSDQNKFDHIEIQ